MARHFDIWASREHCSYVVVAQSCGASDAGVTDRQVTDEECCTWSLAAKLLFLLSLSPLAPLPLLALLVLRLQPCCLRSPDLSRMSTKTQLATRKAEEICQPRPYSLHPASRRVRARPKNELQLSLHFLASTALWCCHCLGSCGNSPANCCPTDGHPL